MDLSPWRSTFVDHEQLKLCYIQKKFVDLTVKKIFTYAPEVPFFDIWCIFSGLERNNGGIVSNIKDIKGRSLLKNQTNKNRFIPF